MKKLTAVLLAILFLLPLYCSCNNTPPDESKAPESAESTEESMKDESTAESVESVESVISEEPLVPDKNAEVIWKDAYADSLIKSPSDIAKATVWYNGNVSDDLNVNPSAGDCKYIFEGKDYSRVVNHADSYALSLPGKITYDFSLDEYRSKYIGENYSVTLTKEEKNPYGNTEKGWNTYLTEWLSIHLENVDYVTSNSLRRLRAVAVRDDVIDGFTVTEYCMCIDGIKNAEYDSHYNIAIIRKPDEYVQFYLLLMKSKTKMLDEFDAVVASFREVSKLGNAKNTVGEYELKIPESWNAETKAYFEKIMAQTTVDWGFYHINLESRGSQSYFANQTRISEWLTWLESDDGLGYKSDIYPTYMALGWGETTSSFPLQQAQEFAGGNGFNGKPVLQMTYQYTTSNNTNLGGYTPMFDILRGKYDDTFRKLAKDIKEYGAPVWFRLNNEMNSDWTSYAGIVTLLDPDIYALTWQRLYDIFIEEGVDNCIFVFNPIAVSVPYSDWGYYLNYFPGVDYCQALGLTYYQMLNETTAEALAKAADFKTMYTELYSRNMPYFSEYPWVIGEFGCASGGETLFDWDERDYVPTTLGRNEATQAKWVSDMFDILSDTQSNEFISRLKYAVWFSVNDYSPDDKITNYLDFYNQQKTVKALREGLARSHKE